MRQTTIDQKRLATGGRLDIAMAQADFLADLTLWIIG